jgi:glycosyltransferase involved in cell wall biosynthesis
MAPVKESKPQEGAGRSESGAQAEASLPGPLRISAVIPTYNRAALVVRAVKSALEQTRPPDEIIVVDDGSTDDTCDRLRHFGDRIRLIREQNAGGAAARNRGVREALFPWIAFLDSDDVWTPRHLEETERAIRGTNARAILYFRDMEGNGSFRWEKTGFAIRGEWELIEDGTPWVMREHQPMMLQGSLFLRSAFLGCGGLWDRLRTAHDTHLFLRLAIGQPVCAVAGPGVRQTDDDDPVNRLTIRSGTVRLGRRINTALLFEDIYRSFPSLPLEYRRIIQERIVATHMSLVRTFFQKRKPGSAALHLLRALKAEPVLSAKHGLRALGLTRTRPS